MPTVGHHLSDPGLFGPFGGRAWLNAAHQGPLPAVAVEAAHAALAEKVAPATLDDESFFALPLELKSALGRLVGVPGEEVILGNSTSYGLDLLAHGLDLRCGDEVLLVEGDFPATITPWLILERDGVRIRRLQPETRPLTAEELEREITPATRVFCSSWVFSFSGEAIDLHAIGKLCRERGVTFIANASQAIGSRPINLAETPVDALVSCGFKWLCGPYATGFCWITPNLRERLTYRQAYWLTQMHGTDLSQEGSVDIRQGQGAEQYDVFGTANFLNFSPWQASIELMLHIGIDTIAAHDQSLVDRLLASLDQTDWRLVSPRDQPARSTLVLIKHDDPATIERTADALAAAGIDIAQRAGALRFSPHLYNTPEDIDRALDVLANA